MNEVCKANNVVPEYKVVEETGPPHEKTFKVELMLPNVGSFEGIASTIRGAKHNAAQLGLETSGLKKPERKPKQSNDAPSVELNSLAMKLGKIVEYSDLPPTYPSQSPIPSNSYAGYMYPDYPSKFMHYRRQPRMLASVKVGDKEYVGEGFRKKEARRNAASKALKDLRKELNTGSNLEQEQSTQASENVQDEIPEPKV